jgi:hypothetical protein
MGIATADLLRSGAVMIMRKVLSNSSFFSPLVQNWTSLYEQTKVIFIPRGRDEIRIDCAKFFQWE